VKTVQVSTKANNTVSDRFTELLNSLMATEVYWVEAAKSEVSDAIYAVMEKEGVSRAELARRLKVSPQYVTKILQGDPNFTLRSLVKIASALNCRLNFENLFVPMKEKEK
jgi:ribosome-binding protein aMBF1 (putative translation factor)